MARDTENQGFTCQNCGQLVEKLTNGSYRNHCPFCLYSKHVDIKPGDRQGACGGLMHPISVTRHKKKGWQLKHKCSQCKHVQMNKIAEGSNQPDNIDLIIKLF